MALKDGRVIGLHKRKAAKKTEQIDVAVSVKAIVSALAVHSSTDNYNYYPSSSIIIAMRFSEVSESQILEHYLAR